MKSLFYFKSRFDPLQILQSATINGARFMGKENSMATIDVGKEADLVILNSNPLLDIKSTQDILLSSIMVSILTEQRWINCSKQPDTLKLNWINKDLKSNKKFKHTLKKLQTHHHRTYCFYPFFQSSQLQVFIFCMLIVIIIDNRYCDRIGFGHFVKRYKGKLPRKKALK